MPLSWSEIRHRAIAFSTEWTGVTSERAEKQTFWNEFFNVFGIRRRVVASFEEPVKKISGDYGYIDLFWSGVVLVGVQPDSPAADAGLQQGDVVLEVNHTKINSVDDFLSMAKTVKKANSSALLLVGRGNATLYTVIKPGS